MLENLGSFCPNTIKDYVLKSLQSLIVFARPELLKFFSPLKSLNDVDRHLGRCSNGKRLTWRPLSLRADVTAPNMSKLEKGRSRFGIEIIRKLAAVLEFEPAELLKLRQR